MQGGVAVDRAGGQNLDCLRHVNFSGNLLDAAAHPLVALEAVLPLFELDSYVDTPLIMMAAVDGDVLDPKVEAAYVESISKTNTGAAPIGRIGRFEFYERTKKAFAVVMTGETAKYGNIILKKGVTPL